MNPQFYDHEVVQQSPDDYIEIIALPKIILREWSASMFAHELLNNDGTVKSEDDLTDTSLKKYLSAHETLKRGEQLPKPIIGIGITEGIEIGIGREIIAVAVVLQLNEIPVCIRKAQSDDVRALLKS